MGCKGRVGKVVFLLLLLLGRLCVVGLRCGEGGVGGGCGCQRPLWLKDVVVFVSWVGVL